MLSIMDTGTAITLAVVLVLLVTAAIGVGRWLTRR